MHVVWASPAAILAYDNHKQKCNVEIDKTVKKEKKCYL